MDKKDGFSKQSVEDQTCVKVDRVSTCEGDSTSQRVDKIMVPQGKEDQSRDKVDKARIWPKVTAGVACDKMLNREEAIRKGTGLKLNAGEDPQVKEQQSNSGKPDVSSQQEGLKPQQMARFRTRRTASADRCSGTRPVPR